MAQKQIQSRFRQKQDTAASWEANDLAQLDGELAIAKTSNGATRMKVGDGTKKFSQLPFIDEPVYTELSGKAALDHTHDAGDIGSGKLAVARIPTGTTASTVALGNHGHTQYLTVETDPTVPAWAKAAVKPSYTAAEVNAVPTSRKVNGKSLATDIVLVSTDVLGAVSLTGATLTDFNTILAPGLYIGSGTTAEAAANSPTNKGFYLRVEQLYTRTLQTVYDYTSTGKISGARPWIQPGRPGRPGAKC